MNWISTKDRRPKRSDAGVLREVLVAYRPELGVRGRVGMLPFHLVRVREHSHWVKIIPPLPDF